jgi:hypothetical protein
MTYACARHAYTNDATRTIANVKHDAIVDELINSSSCNDAS